MSKVGEYKVCPVSKVREYKICPVFKVREYEVCSEFKVREYKICPVFKVREYEVGPVSKIREYEVCPVSKIREYEVCLVSKVREYKVCSVFKVKEYEVCSVFKVREYEVCPVFKVRELRSGLQLSPASVRSHSHPRTTEQLWPLLSWTPPVLHRATDILSNTSNLTSAAALQASSVNTEQINSAVVSHRLKDTEEGELHLSSTSSHNTAAVSSEYRDLYILAKRPLAQRYFGCSQLLERVR